MTQSAERTANFAEHLCAVTNAHDLDRLVDCFTPDYVNEAPAHPERSFRGREQVRRNWAQIFANVPDVTTEVVASAQVGDKVWSEWEMRGTQLDGQRFLMRGVMVFTVEGDRARAVRFYVEPVDGASRTDAWPGAQLRGVPRP